MSAWEKKAFVMTVGTGNRSEPDRVTSLLEALERSIRDARPDRTVLLASKDSLENAERIQADLPQGDTVRVETLTNANDYEATFRDAVDVLRGLWREGFEPRQIDVNYTSGTKAMSVGLAFAALDFGCASLHYIAGDRPTGTVAGGTEQFIQRAPERIRASAELRIALRLLADLQFVAARRLVGTINGDLFDDYGRRLHADLKRLVEVYANWDKFDHTAANEGYRKPDPDLRELTEFAVSNSARRPLTEMAERPEELTENKLADLWGNAERRVREGKYDDAVARLYRLTEMVAQFQLARRHGIDTSNVETKALPTSLPQEARAWLAEKAKGSKKIQLGLRDAYSLLAYLDDPLGHEMPRFGESGTALTTLLEKRNGSILAHGFTPITPADAENLAGEVKRLAALVVPDFAERCAQLQFPWLVRG